MNDFIEFNIDVKKMTSRFTLTIVNHDEVVLYINR